MSLETDNLNQAAVVWRASGTTDNTGESKVNAADSISVRWEDSQGTIQDGQGNVVAYDAVVYISSEIALDSAMFQGTLKAFNAATAPELYRVVGTDSVPDVKGINFRRKVLLARLSAELPAIAS